MIPGKATIDDQYNAANEQMKRQCFGYIAAAQELSVDAVAKAIAHFEAYTRYKDFKTFSRCGGNDTDTPAVEAP